MVDRISKAATGPTTTARALRGEALTVTLCGSTRFERLFRAWNQWLSLAGHRVYTLSTLPSFHGSRYWLDHLDLPDAKERLDAVHRLKIADSDAVVILNRFAYMGDATLDEYHLAVELGIPVYFLESWGAGLGITARHEPSETTNMEAHGLRRARAFETGPGVAASPIDTHRHPSPVELLGPAGALRSAAVRDLGRNAKAPPWLPHPHLSDPATTGRHSDG